MSRGFKTCSKFVKNKREWKKVKFLELLMNTERNTLRISLCHYGREHYTVRFRRFWLLSFENFYFSIEVNGELFDYSF